MEVDVGVWDPDFGMEECYVGGIATNEVENNLLILKVVRPQIGEGLV